MKYTNIDTLAGEASGGLYLSADLYIHLRRDDGESFYPEKTRLDTLGICFVERGSYRIKVNSVYYRLKAGDLLFCHPNDFYEEVFFSKDFKGLIVFASAECIFGTIGKDTLMDCLSSLRKSSVIKPDAKSVGLLKSYCCLIEKQLTLNVKNDYDALILVCKAFVTDIIKRILIKEEESQVESKSRTHTIFQQFINLLISTPSKPHDYKWYAEQLYISPKYLSAVCKKESGKTAVEWIREYIMNDARRYLLGSDLSVKEIATQLGFDNFAFFCKTFKRHFSKTPLQIRNKS